MKTLYKLVLFLMLVILLTNAEAQVIKKKEITLDIAKQIVNAIEDEAKKNNVGGAIAVVDDGGNLVYFVRIDNTFFAGAEISIGKAWTAAGFKKPTKVFEDAIKNGRTALIGVEKMTPLQGGIPIIVDGQLVGAVGVSGASSQQQDEEFAILGAELAVKLINGSKDKTLYFNEKDVDDSFSKGGVLTTNNDFAINTSKRDTPGLAEVHNNETDLFYVLDGSATIVTGGEVVDGKVTEPNEIRGTSITGGETQNISKGDVVVIPNGTPHWFKEVQSPILYYTVKVK